jgi:hypothetical protein
MTLAPGLQRDWTENGSLKNIGYKFRGAMVKHCW